MDSIDKQLRLNTRGWKIRTAGGFVPFVGVSTMGVKTTHRVTFDDGQYIDATANHAFFDMMGYEVRVGELVPGMVLDGITPKMVTSIVPQTHEMTYDVVEVDTHTFYANGMLCHNCVFVSSDPLLINTITLSNLTGILEKVTAKARVGHLTFFHKPAPNKTYLVGVDPATGTGQDYTVFEVFQFPEMIQVAEYRSNTTSPITAYNELKKLLRALKKFDSVVYFTIENNGIGEGMLNQYEMDEFPPEDAEFISEEGKRRKGMYTTARSKALACLRLKEMLEKGLIEIRSKALLAELKHFIRAGGSYRAKRGATDDCISGTLLVLRLITEISEYEQDAHDMLYSSEDEGTLYEEVDAIDWGDSSGGEVEDYQDTPFIV